MNLRDESSVVGQTRRFLIFGGMNTLVTYLAFVGLSALLHPAFAYTIVFVASLLVIAGTANLWVFRGERSLKRSAAYVVLYLFVFSVAQGVLYLLDPVEISELFLTGLIISANSALLTFVVGRCIFSHSASSSV